MEPESRLQELPIYAEYRESVARYAVLLGGAGSGKSMAAAHKVVQRAHATPGLCQLVVRKVAATLARSVYALLALTISEAGLGKWVRAYPGKLAFHFRNGSKILLSGLDDPEKIKSIQGIGSIWIEEATELEEADFSQLELRMRGATPGYKQFTLTFNPIDEQHWLKARFCNAQPPDDLYFLQTTYRDNPLLDAPYIAHLEDRIKADENLHRIYSLGQWGRLHQGGLFYKSFSMLRHVVPRSYDPDLPLHISFDFNVQPYITLCIWQAQGSAAWQIAELCLSSPVNTSPALCRHFMALYPAHQSGLFVYGDPSGHNSSTQAELGESDFGVILRTLAPMQPMLKRMSKAPGLVPRGLFINAIWAQGYAGISLMIDPGCTHTLADYQNLQEAQDGSKLKTRKRDPQTKIVAEQYGHTSDANDYFICKYFEREFADFGRPARKPLPPIAFGR